MAYLSLHLDSTKHIYNPKYRTFHITAYDLYGRDDSVQLLHNNAAGPLAIRLTGETGVSVEFSHVRTVSRCTLYKARYAHDVTAPAVDYHLLVWNSIEGRKIHYTENLNFYGMWAL